MAHSAEEVALLFVEITNIKRVSNGTKMPTQIPAGKREKNQHLRSELGLNRKCIRERKMSKYECGIHEMHKCT